MRIWTSTWYLSLATNKKTLKISSKTSIVTYKSNMILKQPFNVCFPFQNWVVCTSSGWTFPVTASLKSPLSFAKWKPWSSLSWTTIHYLRLLPMWVSLLSSPFPNQDKWNFIPSFIIIFVFITFFSKPIVVLFVCNLKTFLK